MGFTITISAFFLLFSVYCERFKKCSEDPKYSEFLRDNILCTKSYLGFQKTDTVKNHDKKKKKTFLNVFFFCFKIFLKSKNLVLQELFLGCTRILSFMHCHSQSSSTILHFYDNEIQDGLFISFNILGFCNKFHPKTQNNNQSLPIPCHSICLMPRTVLLFNEFKAKYLTCGLS